jgi:E3 ubiquitin-protein ligase UBR1
MIAQIRTGLWVRNGFAIRGQLLHYRDYMLRELCYDQDLFILQAGFVLLDPDLVLVTMMERFQLLDWFSGNTTHPLYEGNHLIVMVEEFFYALITSLSERANATKLSLDEVVRREAIHGLALGPCSYSELCKRVAERIMDEASFDRALHSIANFKSPEGINDVGQYELRDELYGEVNPFFFHYTRNRREEVESILKTRITRRTGRKNPVVEPRTLDISDGPFMTLNQTFESHVLLRILAVGLYNTAVRTDLEGPSSGAQSTDAVLDQVLHVIMLALKERPEIFSRLAGSVVVTGAGEQTLTQLLCTMETLEKVASVKPKVQWCLDTIGQYDRGTTERYRTEEEPPASGAKNDLEAKKRAAKARQAAIMRQFAAQQKSFLESVEDEDISDSEDGDAMDEDIHDPTKDLGACIVCQEELDSTKSFGGLGFVQASRFRRQTPSGSAYHVTEVLNVLPNFDDTVPLPPPPEYVRPSDSFNGFPAGSTEFGLHTSFCGHFMHVECFKVYTFSVEQRHLQQTQRNHAENIERDEFVCPLCKSLGNVILPVFDDQTYSNRPKLAPPTQSLSEWARGVDIELLRTPQDRALDTRLSIDGSGEFTFWTAEDTRYNTNGPVDDVHKMVQTLKNAGESISQQSFHLHGRLPPADGNAGGGMYFPRDLVAYTIACLEIAQRGIPRSGGSTVAENMTESSMHAIRATLVSLRKLAALQFPDRADGGRTAIRQALIKRLMPQWTRDPLRLPLLFRDPLTILVEVAAVAPDILPHAITLMYYACLARTCLALLSILGDLSPTQLSSPKSVIPYDRLFGDVRIFVMSVARHSPELERFAAQILRAHSDKFEKLVYTFTLPFLRQAAILTRAVTAIPLSHPISANFDATEYERLMDILHIPLLSQLPQHESLQTVLAGWSSTYGVLHSLSVIDCSISLEMPTVYRMAQLPRALDSLFTNPHALFCHRCRTIPTDAAICMFCGTVCCYQMHCCVDEGQRLQGECNMHTREFVFLTLSFMGGTDGTGHCERRCGGVIGLYYCVKRCAMLYLYAGNGSTGPPPYLDIHGEVDLAMRQVLIYNLIL